MTVYLSSATRVWADSISGLPVAVRRRSWPPRRLLRARRGGQPPARTPSGTPLDHPARPARSLLCVLAFLTRYAAARAGPRHRAVHRLLPGPRAGRWAVGFLARSSVGIAPWLVRNSGRQRRPAGPRPLHVAQRHRDAVRGQHLRAHARADADVGRLVGEAQGQGRPPASRALQRRRCASLGDGLFVCLFITAFFYRFVREPGAPPAVVPPRWPSAAPGRDRQRRSARRPPACCTCSGRSSSSTAWPSSSSCSTGSSFACGCSTSPITTLFIAARRAAAASSR